MHSDALHGTLRYAVYLPPDYARSQKRYPVVYFLHGLPAPAAAYRDISFVARALERTGQDAVVVAPQGARVADPDPEYLNWGPGRNWATAIATELPAVVDARYRTIRDRSGRALVGLSAGGYGAVQLALHHLENFSVVESWSGYFHATDPSGTKPLDLGSSAATARASVHRLVPMLRKVFARRPTFLAFYVGSEDKRFRAENEQLDDELTAARVPHVFREYPGAHEHSVWTAHAPMWLSLALKHLAQPTA